MSTLQQAVLQVTDATTCQEPQTDLVSFCLCVAVGEVVMVVSSLPLNWHYLLVQRLTCADVSTILLLLLLLQMSVTLAMVVRFCLTQQPSARSKKSWHP